MSLKEIIKAMAIPLNHSRSHDWFRLSISYYDLATGESHDLWLLQTAQDEEQDLVIKCNSHGSW